MHIRIVCFVWPVKRYAFAFRGLAKNTPNVHKEILSRWLANRAWHSIAWGLKNERLTVAINPFCVTAQTAINSPWWLHPNFQQVWQTTILPHFAFISKSSVNQLRKNQAVATGFKAFSSFTISHTKTALCYKLFHGCSDQPKSSQLKTPGRHYSCNNTDSHHFSICW